MKCVIPDINIKTFGKAIQSLAKIGDELSIEPTLDGLLMKAVNSTRTCMSRYEFKPRFFQHYDDGSPRPVDKNISPRYRMSSKSCLNIFRSLNNMDKLVDYCQIKAHDSQCRVVFSLHCKHGIVKTYNLTYMEAEPLRCLLTQSSCAHHMKADAKLYMEIFSNFPSSVDELTFIAKPQSLCVRNFVDADSVDPMKTFNTTMTLEDEEFESYDVKSEVSISFCLKEMKTALMFGDFAGATFALHFNEPGRPMFIVMDNDPTFEASFIVSTISENLSQTSSASGSVASTSTAHNHTHHQTHNTSVSSPATNQSHHTRPQASHSRKYIGRLDKSHQQQSHVPAAKQGTRRSSAGDRRVADSHTSSTIIHNNTSEVEIKPKPHSLMNDTSISLLPTNNTLSKQKQNTERSAGRNESDVDSLLRQIDEKSKSVSSTNSTIDTTKVRS